jgi:hypothetical protein
VDLTPDALAPSGGEPAGAFPVTGILGESGQSGSVRLFLDTGFSTFYDIPREAVLRREKIPAERSPLGVDSTLLLVAAGTHLVAHRAVSRRIEDEFLAGDITASGSFAPSLGTQAGTGPGYVGSIPTASCNCSFPSLNCCGIAGAQRGSIPTASCNCSFPSLNCCG